MKKNNNFSELMSYAGKHRYFTYFSLVLSVISAVLMLLPFVFIFYIIKEVIEVAPNFAEAVNVARNGWFAVLFALIGIVVYIGALMCSHLSAFRIAGNMRKTLMSHIAKLPLGFVGEMGSDALDRVNSILDKKPLPDPQKPDSPKDNSVEFSSVSFRYDGAEADAINGVSFKVQPGETVALVGPSGGGKTTAAGLISRFWDVSGGEIKVGGVDVKNIEKSELMDTVSYVFQDSRLLKTSILENVRLTKPNASREEVETALHKAQCDDIIAKLPNGIDEMLDVLYEDTRWQE